MIEKNDIVKHTDTQLVGTVNNIYYVPEQFQPIIQVSVNKKNITISGSYNDFELIGKHPSDINNIEVNDIVREINTQRTGVVNQIFDKANFPTLQVLVESEDNKVISHVAGSFDCFKLVAKHPSNINGFSRKQVMSPPYEPKYRDRVSVKFTDLSIPEYVLKEGDKPTYIPNADAWQSMTFRFYDPISPSTSQVFYEATSKNSDQKLNFYIQTFDPTGVVVEQWFVEPKDIEFIDYGLVTYHSTYPSEVMVIFNIKRCTLEF